MSENVFEPGTEEYDAWERQDRNDGPALLDEVRDALNKFVVLPTKNAEVAVTLWIAATHAAPALYHFPRLAIRSPEKRCGKTRLLDIIHALCHRAIPTANISPAALYRIMGGDDPRTLLVDEADVIWGNKKQAEANEDLRGLINAGFERGRSVIRYNVAIRDVEELPTFGFVALAGIGALPDTITDRSVNIVMRRRAATEKVQPFRSRRDGEPLEQLRERLNNWVRENSELIGSAEPELPVEDRAADVWESLVAVADVAGGAWPELARAAAKEMSKEHDEEDNDANDAVVLMNDIKAVFDRSGRAFLPSKELVAGLRLMDDSPWGGQEEDLTANKLAARLRHYKIKPKSDGSARGYKRTDFNDAWSRYGESSSGGVSGTVKTSNPQEDATDTTDGLTDRNVNPSTVKQPSTRESDGLTVTDASFADDWARAAYDREY